MVQFVAADASKAEQGNRSFLVGVAIEVSNGSDFDDHYFQLVDEFTKKYGIELGHNILKAGDVLNRVPSFSLRDADETLVKGLVQNQAIDRIHITIGWFDQEEVQLPRGNTKSGIVFANQNLIQYFPIISVWRYHREYRQYGSIPDVAWIDRVQGKITKAWKYIGEEFSLNMVPHGDVTYPSLSTADIIANHLARTLPKSKPFSELPSAAAGTLLSYQDDTPQEDDCWITGDAVNEEHQDHIVPDYHHTIQGEVHYPHPVLFVYDDVFQQYDQEVLPGTDFHAFTRKWAQDNAGCVIKLEPHRLPSIVQSGDRIVYTEGTDARVCELLTDLNPTKDIEIMSSREFMETALEG